ncbi:hypothetical protein EZV62_012189 [Acer yangbiense]|uniref:glucan endo-1,3-beta-D-glucosidase n=1 Tax=Acer yangbiense TaxID=1000413 RepID=A0A5C7HWW6_9ROSI|nr:hypothetical protein EZV62_012189 [Acer yangbiense]
MDPDEIAWLCESLSIKSKEEKLWSVKDGLTAAARKKLELCVVGKVFSHKHINREAFRTVMPKIWRTQGLEIEVVRDNIFLFYFRNQKDRTRTLAGGPWCFDNCLLALEKVNGVGDIDQVGFHRADFWVQIHNAPLLCMTKEMGMFLGQIIGELKDIDVGSTGECFGKYLRVRVAIDLNQPLKRFLRMDLTGDGKESLLLLRYKKLPEYCFHCGRLGHSFSDCGLRKENHARPMDVDFEFGAWLRVLNPPRSHKSSSGRRFRGSEGSSSQSGRSLSPPQPIVQPLGSDGPWRNRSGGGPTDMEDTCLGGPNALQENRTVENSRDSVLNSVRCGKVGGMCGDSMCALQDQSSNIAMNGCLGEMQQGNGGGNGKPGDVGTVLNGCVGLNSVEGAGAPLRHDIKVAESSLHALWNCKKLQMVRNNSGFLGGEMRNQVVFGKAGFQAAEVWEWASGFLKDFRSSCIVEGGQPKVVLSQPAPRWQAPHVVAAPVGVFYGHLANNLPLPADVINLLQSNGISNVRIFNPDPSTLQSFSVSGIKLMIGVPNEILPYLATGNHTLSLQCIDSIANQTYQF